jgi:hypothetical protein
MGNCFPNGLGIATIDECNKNDEISNGLNACCGSGRDPVRDSQIRKMSKMSEMRALFII